ncbi:hypothetical protein Ae505Ps2_2810c [Pseudonocardia sp. Ae505_Ps2]|nr:hypothetical protein Ae331Ps2_3432c [Pseudonocardia sp. Ae331_Ps2]OLM12682.1 hypothetical protein Ae505Ps2_2810c [Pseudonocardia sp. Ae505_Ps2]
MAPAVLDADVAEHLGRAGAIPVLFPDHSLRRPGRRAPPR